MTLRDNVPKLSLPLYALNYTLNKFIASQHRLSHHYLGRKPGC